MNTVIVLSIIIAILVLVIIIETVLLILQNKALQKQKQHMEWEGISTI